MRACEPCNRVVRLLGVQSRRMSGLDFDNTVIMQDLMFYNVHRLASTDGAQCAG